MTTLAAKGNSGAATQAVTDYGQVQGAKALNIAAHAHVIEFGVLAILLAFFQPYVYLSEKWRRRWVVTLLFGSLALPVCVLLELRFGLTAGGMADNPEDPLPNLSISGHQTTQLPSVTKSKQHGGAPPFRVWFLRWSLPFLGQSFCLGGSAFPHISTVSPNSLNPANPFKSVDFRPSYSNDTP